MQRNKQLKSPMQYRNDPRNNMCAHPIKTVNSRAPQARQLTRTFARLILVFLSVFMPAFPQSAYAFRVYDVRNFGLTDLGIARWDAAPHFVDGVERSLDGGLRYSLEGGSYEAFRNKFQWVSPTPSVAAFQKAIEDAFLVWEVLDRETGLGTDLYFVPDLDTPVSLIEPPDTLDGRFVLNPGAEIDIASGHLDGFVVRNDLYGDPTANSVTLTSGIENYPAAVISGADIRMNVTGDGSPWHLDTFKEELIHGIGHAIGLYNVDPLDSDITYSLFYDDNYDATSNATARATLTNPFADRIDPLDPDHSPGLSLFEPCGGNDCSNTPGIDSPGADILMETNGRLLSALQNDDLAGRQFLYPYVRIPGDFNADQVLTVEDIDLLSSELRLTVPRNWFDLTGDGVVSEDDRIEWVKELKKTFFGDANLDGQFNSGDLVDVFQAGKYELNLNASWSQGDWTGDRRFDSSDLVVAFQDGGYEQGPRPSVSTVPEPSGGVIHCPTIAWWIFRRKK